MPTPADTAVEIADELLPDPFRSNTRDRLTAAVLTLRDAEVPDDTIRDVLGGVVGALRSEYGE